MLLQLSAVIVGCLLLPNSFGRPLILGVTPRGDTKYSSIVVFGDSYSDDGHGAFVVSNGTWPPSIYHNGSFSNGPVWSDYLAGNLSIPVYNHAVGGATSANRLVQGYTGKNSTIAVPGVYEQIESFNQDDIANTLFIISGGINDILFNPNITATQSVEWLGKATQLLLDKGAKHFLFFSYPDMSLIPYDQYIPVGSKISLSTFLKTFSYQLRAKLSAYAKGITGAKFVDLMPVFERFYFYGEPTEYGYQTYGAYGSCAIGVYGEGGITNVSVCNEPDQMVFWDEYHPTSRNHGWIAEAFKKELGGQA